MYYVVLMKNLSNYHNLQFKNDDAPIVLLQENESVIELMIVMYSQYNL